MLYDKTWVSQVAQNYLANVVNNQFIISGHYLNDETNENFIEMAKHLYQWDTRKMKLLNPWSFLWSVVFWKYTSFLRRPYQVNPIFRNVDYSIFIENILSCWKILLSVDSEWWEYIVNNLRASEYYNTWNKRTFESKYNTEYIIKMYAKDPEMHLIQTPDIYLHIKEIDWWIIRNKLYQLNSATDMTLWEEVPLNTIPETTGLPEIVDSKLDKVIYSIRVEDALIDQCKSIIYAVDRKLANAEKHFNEYTEQFKIFSNINFPPNAIVQREIDWVTVNVIDFDKIWKNLSSLHHGDWKANIDIVENVNKLLTEAQLFIQKQYLQFSAITDLPLFFLWQVQEWWNDTWASKIKSSWAFYQRITRYRDKIEDLYNQVLNGLPKKEELVILWHSVIKIDESEQIEIEARKLKLWLSSRSMSIQKQMWCWPDKAKEILEEIKKEQEEYWISEDFDIYSAWENTWLPKELNIS